MATVITAYILQDVSGNPLIGINDGVINGRLVIRYYDANSGTRYSGIVSSVAGAGPFSNTYILQDESGNPLIGNIDGLLNDKLIVSYYDANSGLRYSGIVTIISTTGSTGLDSITMTATAGSTVTLPSPVDTKTVEVIIIDNVVTVKTINFTQSGDTITYNSSVVLAGGEQLLIIFK